MASQRLRRPPEGLGNALAAFVKSEVISKAFWGLSQLRLGSTGQPS